VIDGVDGAMTFSHEFSAEGPSFLELLEAEGLTPDDVLDMFIIEGTLTVVDLDNFEWE
jgi:hypothetical protein